MNYYPLETAATTMARKIKILFLSADPVKVNPRPRIGKEFSEIAKRIQVGSYKDRFELVSAWAVSPADLQELILEHQPDVLHLSVPGSSKGIVLEDEDGEFKPVSSEALKNLLALFKAEIKIVFLNARCSKSQREALNGVIDYTIIMNRAIQDKSAIRFAAAFYRSLAFGKNVVTAFELSKNDLDLQSLPGTDAPELLVRPTVNTAPPFVESLGAVGDAAT